MQVEFLGWISQLSALLTCKHNEAPCWTADTMATKQVAQILNENIKICKEKIIKICVTAYSVWALGGDTL